MEHRSGRIDRAPAVKATDKGRDWRAEVGARNNSSRSVDLARAGEPGRGREANTPAQIPPRGWRDILWRVLWSISVDRILSTSGGVAFFALLAVFPGIAAIVSLYGLFDDQVCGTVPLIQKKGAGCPCPSARSSRIHRWAKETDASRRHP